ncbi:polyphenol oxidase family protein [Candidatus Peregrinibacteria bacterium]|nr:MAG: polyphenol oxidase family protein [Candidatus Peregrinibacteria bacterium]
MHSTRIQKVETGKEDFAHCDGLWSENPNFLLGIQTADCAPVAFLGREKIGIVHAGWRGLVSGILEEMQQVFSGESHSVRIGPLLPEFEIQKDFCFEAIFSRFGAHFFFEQNGRITFRFLEALTSLLPEAEFCGISTFQNPNYASWRRDQSFPKGKNVSIVSFRKVFLSEK